MIPGASKAMKDVIEDDAFKHMRHYSFDDSIERSKPSLIDVKESKNSKGSGQKLSKSIN
jgi:hypothetical protein